MKRVLSGVAATALVMVVAVVVALSFPGFWLKPLLENRLTARLDRQVRIADEVRLTVFGPPAVIAYDVSVANPDWADAPWLLQAERLRVVFDAGALWSFSLHPTIVSLRVPRLYLARNGDGAATWTGVGGLGSGTPGPERLVVDDGRFRYRAPGDDTDLTGTFSTTADGIDYSASGTYKGRETSASGTGGPLLVLLRGEEPWPLEAEVTAGGHDVSLQGTTTGLPTPTGVDLTVAGAGPGLDGLGDLVGGGLPSSPPYDLAGRLTLTDGRWQFSDASGSIGESAIAGMVAVVPPEDGRALPRLIVDLSSSHLAMQDVRAVLGGSAPASGEGPVQIPSQALRDYDADVSLDADELVIAGQTLTNASLRATLGDGRLSLDPVMATLGGGRLTGSAELAATSPPTASVTLDLNRLALTPPAGVAGVFGGTVDLKASGETLQAMRGNTSGRVTLLLSDGRLTRHWLDMTQVGLGDLVAAFIPEGNSTTAIRCAAARVEIREGVARAQAFHADTEAAVVRGTGSIDLRDLTLDLAFTMDSKEAATFAHGGPLHATGSLRDPGIEAGGIAATVLEGLGAITLGTVLTPTAAAVPFADTAVGARSGCHRALDDPVTETRNGGKTGAANGDD